MNIEIWIKDSDVELSGKSKYEILDMFWDFCEQNFYNYTVDEA